MPVYDYECKKCGHTLIDVKQKINDDKLTECPKCKKQTLNRKIGNSSFHLKGGGWCESFLDKNSG